MNIYGFTFIKNGIKYDYPFIETLKSLHLLCPQVYVALGDSEDQTEQLVNQLDFVKTKKTVWDPQLKDGAVILSQQTNVALNFAREELSNLEDAWGFYLQCDECIHEDEVELIKKDIRKANEQGHDAISFRYFHFWKSHHTLAVNKKWYPQEIRAIKLKSSIESWGDAQSFRNTQKIYVSDATIYHYGHVRKKENYAEKKRDILKLYHEEEKLKKYQKREKRYDKATEELPYWGSHPKLMHQRITQLGETPQAKSVKQLNIILGNHTLPEHFLKSIMAEKIKFVLSPFAIPKKERQFPTLCLNSNLFYQFMTGGLLWKVPRKMKNPQAREFPFLTYVTLLLSYLNVGVKSSST